MEAVAQVGGDDAGVVEVKSADGNGVIEEHAVICHVEHVGGETPVLTKAVSCRNVEGGMDRQVVSVIGAYACAGEAIVKSGAVIDIGCEPCFERQIRGESRC